jgi:uncharacterized membrane protein YphA (DoxX/SURF4 family)
MPHFVGLASCGGIAILIGLSIRIEAICVAIVMLGAILLVRLPHGFDINQGWFECALHSVAVVIKT